MEPLPLPPNFNPQLADRQSEFYVALTTAVDELEAALHEGDQKRIKEMHTIIHTWGKFIKSRKNGLCTEYRFPDPDPADPQLWSILCTSGASGKTRRKPGACTNCVLFNPQYQEAAKGSSTPSTQQSLVQIAPVPPPPVEAVSAEPLIAEDGSLTYHCIQGIAEGNPTILEFMKSFARDFLAAPQAA